jgi:hypothetical protein
MDASQPGPPGKTILRAGVANSGCCSPKHHPFLWARGVYISVSMEST